MERSYEAPTTRQMVFAALCGIFTAGTTFVFWPVLFRTLYLCYLEPIYEYQIRDNEFLGFLKFIVLDLPAVALIVGSIAVIFLYLNKKQKTGPYCFWINLFCQYGVLYLFYSPFEQIVFLHTGYFGPGLGELLLPILLPPAVVLAQWGIFQYLQDQESAGDPQDGQDAPSQDTGAQAPKGRGRLLAAADKLCRPLCLCLLPFVLAVLALYSVYYPYTFHHYVNSLDVETCQVEVYTYSVRQVLNQTQQAELFKQMKALKYDSARGPYALSEEGTDIERSWTCFIYIRTPEGELLPPFSVDPRAHSAGFFQKSFLFPSGYWLTTQKEGDIYSWLEALNIQAAGTIITGDGVTIFKGDDGTVIRGDHRPTS